MCAEKDKIGGINGCAQNKNQTKGIKSTCVAAGHVTTCPGTLHVGGKSYMYDS